MNRRKRRSNPLFIIMLLVLVGGAVYVDRVVVPVTPPLFIATPTPTRSPDSFLTEARDFAQKGLFEKSVVSYNQAVQSDPRNINTYIEVARMQVMFGKYDDAIENVQNALLLNSNNSLAHAVMGWALGRKSDYLKGNGELSEAIKIDPGNALAYAYLAEVLAQQQNEDKGDLTTIDKATEASRNAQKYGPDLMETRRARGLVLEMTGNYQEAITEFEAAVQMNDNLADLHLHLGRNYKAVDPPQLEKAIEEFGRAIALKPDDPQPYVETALTYMKAGSYPKAAQYANDAIRQDPSDPLLYGYLGTIDFRQENYGDAIPPLRLATRGGVTTDGVQVKGIPLDQTSNVIYARYGLSLAHTGACGEALQISQTLMQSFPDDENNVYNANEIVNVCKEVANGPSPTPLGAASGTQSETQNTKSTPGAPSGTKTVAPARGTSTPTPAK
jgi:tetratricopeptide (TPR) repeat protein